MAAESRPNWLAAGMTPQRVMVAAALFILGYLAVLVASNAITHHRLAGEEAALYRTIGELERRELRLAALRAYMQSDSFIEMVARENGLVLPGETAVVPLQAGPEELPAVRPGEPWWDRYFADGERQERRH